MSDTSDDVLRDLLLARGLNEVAVDALIKVAARIQWLQELNEDDRSLYLQGEEAVSFAVNTMDDLLSSRSRQFAPKRPPRPLPSMEVMNGALREVWANSSVSGRQVEIFAHPRLEGRRILRQLQRPPFVSLGDMAQLADDARDDEPR